MALKSPLSDTDAMYNFLGRSSPDILGSRSAIKDKVVRNNDISRNNQRNSKLTHVSCFLMRNPEDLTGECQ